MKEPLVSIIIPTYNRGSLIKETLDSILNQSFINWECIIVDDGSTDQTFKILVEYVKNDVRFKYYRRLERYAKGANGCRNYGFELSKGDYIKWFDSDDIMLPDLLKKQVYSITNNDVNVCKIQYYDFTHHVVIKENNIRSTSLIEDYLVGNVTFYVSGPLWKKNFLKIQKDLFDESISNLDDWDFNLRMLYQSPKISYIEEPLIKYRIHENSLSQEIVKCNFKEIISEFRARHKHLKINLFSSRVDTRSFKLFVISRNKYYLRESLVKNDSSSFFLFINLIFALLVSLKIISVVKTVFAYFGLKYFNVGYKLLK